MLLRNLTRLQVQGGKNPAVSRALVEASIQTRCSGPFILQANIAVPNVAPFLLGMTGGATVGGDQIRWCALGR